MAKVPAVQTETILFNKVETQAVKDGENVYVLFKPLCESLGLSYSGQFERINRDESLIPSIRVMRTVGHDGKGRQMTFLELDGFMIWLGGIETSRIKDPKKRKALVKYKTAAGRVLRNHFFAEHKIDNHSHDTNGSVGPAYHDFTPPRTAPGEVEVYSPPATLADLAAFGVDLKKDFMDNLSKNMPEILKHAMEHGGKRSFMSQWREKTRAYIAETVAEDVSQVDDQIDEMGESLEKVRDRLIELEAAHKKLAKKISADKGLSNKVKRQMGERLEAIEDDIASLKRVVAPVKKKKKTDAKSKKRTLN